MEGGFQVDQSGYELPLKMETERSLKQKIEFRACSEYGISKNHGICPGPLRKNLIISTKISVDRLTNKFVEE